MIEFFSFCFFILINFNFIQSMMKMLSVFVDDNFIRLIFFRLNFSRCLLKKNKEEEVNISKVGASSSSSSFFKIKIHSYVMCVFAFVFCFVCLFVCFDDNEMSCKNQKKKIEIKRKDYKVFFPSLHCFFRFSFVCLF